MELPLTLWHEWLLHNLLPPLSCPKNTFLDVLFNYETITMLNRIPSLLSGPIFNTA